MSSKTPTARITVVFFDIPNSSMNPDSTLVIILAAGWNKEILKKLNSAPSRFPSLHCKITL
jgi:hypothetical protein